MIDRDKRLCREAQTFFYTDFFLHGFLHVFKRSLSVQYTRYVSVTTFHRKTVKSYLIVMLSRYNLTNVTWLCYSNVL